MRPRTKAERELQWWQEELYRIAMWYHGHIESLWGIPSPGPHDVLPGFEGLNICYRHEPTLSEPQVIDDARVHAAFNRLRLTRIREQGPEESKEVLWGIS
jgi:hypothetical protein